ncbi:F-box/LRR-repeat protein 25-like protein [Tanacetum coccineum]
MEPIHAPTHPDDVPDEKTKIGTSIVDTAALTIQSFAPTKKIHQHLFPSEREAAAIEMMEDRISLLPDCPLVEIISRLDSTEEVIRTCVLSKRWKNLWTQVPILNFTIDLYTEDADRIPEFISYVKKVVNQRGQSRLNKFVLGMPYDIRNESIVSKLIRYAVTCNVQDLDLSLVNPDDFRNEFVLDQFFFFNSSFNHLRLDGCSFNNVIGVISWSNLKSLYIGYGKLDENVVKNILSGSPLLENLELVDCFGFGRIDITSPSVKKLVVSGYSERVYSEPRYIVEIYAPHILSLTIEELMLSKVVLLNVSSLVEARLDYWMTGPSSTKEREEMLKGHILSLGHVRILHIGYNCLEILARLEAEGFTFPSNMKYRDWSDNED